MTKKELASMNPLDYAQLIIQERLDRMYKQNTPMADKLRESIMAIENVKKTHSSERVVPDGTC